VSYANWRYLSPTWLLHLSGAVSVASHVATQAAWHMRHLSTMSNGGHACLTSPRKPIPPCPIAKPWWSVWCVSEWVGVQCRHWIMHLPHMLVLCVVRVAGSCVIPHFAGVGAPVSYFIMPLTVSSGSFLQCCSVAMVANRERSNHQHCHPGPLGWRMRSKCTGSKDKLG